MKKTLFILCALLLTAVGASAQEATTAYTFSCKDWAATYDHSASGNGATTVTYGDNDNTITVTATGELNVALSNSPTAHDGEETDGITTGKYYITQDQKYFVVVGTNLLTTAGDLWWMNGTNLYGLVPKSTTLNDGKILFVWDLSSTTVFPEATNAFEGWTCFALTSTTGTSVISDICFYTQEAAIEKYPELKDVLQHDAIPYEFHAEDWVTLDTDRLLQTGITYNADNTITVAPNNGASGTNNVALGNSYTQTNTAATISTNGYYITSEQTYFVIVGKDLATETNPTGNGSISNLWWLNGVNANVTPSAPISLGNGQTLFYWDFSGNTTVMGKFDDGKMVIDGWTGGGLTATGETATISYIGFCKPDEVSASFTIPKNTYVHACTANENVWTFQHTGTGTNGAFGVDTNQAQGDDSGMEPPLLSYYVWEGDGATLSAATITHDALTLDAGVYEVSMDIRIIDYDEGLTVGEGTLFQATSGSNTVSQDLKLGVDAEDVDFNNHEDLYGTYKLYVTVAEGESLTVSLVIPENATYNWITFKNLKVKSLGADATPVTVSGTMQADYGTLILPFDADISSNGITAYTAGGVEDDVLTLTAVEGELKAGTPYIIGGSANTTYSFSGVPTAYNASNPDENNLLVGTLVDMDYDDFAANSTEYVLQNHTETDGGGLAFYPIVSGSSSDVTLGAYHCYLTLDSSAYPNGVRAFISLPGSDEETAIKAIEGEEAETNGAIYDLSGRKVSKAVKGVYIQNGKKVLVK